MRKKLFLFLMALVCTVNVFWEPISAYALNAENWAPPRRRQTLIDTAYLISLIQTRARVCGIQFDDGNITHYTVATPILLQYGLIGSFGIVTKNTDTNPYAMTSAQLHEMYFVDNFDFQDHTWDHNAALWGDSTQGPTWSLHISRSRRVFANWGYPDSIRAYNQPGGTGEGWSHVQRDTLAQRGYKYAAGRVGLNVNQFRNMHFGAIDDPFSWGRWCYSWTYNAPAAALEAQGVDLFTDEGRRMLEATVAIIQGDAAKSSNLLLGSSPTTTSMVQQVAAAWTWQAEVAVIETRYADAWAQGGTPIVVFHVVDANAAAGLDALCAWLVANNAVVLGMDDLNALAQLDRFYQHGINIAPPLGVDLDGNGQLDGDDPYVYTGADGTATNGSPGTYYMGTPAGKLVVTTTILPSVNQTGPDDFSMYYERYKISPTTWTYTTSQEARLHTLLPGQAQTFTDTLDIDDRTDRVKHWVAGINNPNLPFVITDLSAVPLSNPTGVSGRTPTITSSLRAYPNPTAGEFTVETDTPTAFKVFDAAGRLVMTGSTTGSGVSKALVTLKAPSGMYFIRALSADRRAAIGQKILLLK